MIATYPAHEKPHRADSRRGGVGQRRLVGLLLWLVSGLTVTLTSNPLAEGLPVGLRGADVGGFSPTLDAQMNVREFASVDGHPSAVIGDGVDDGQAQLASIIGEPVESPHSQSIGESSPHPFEGDWRAALHSLYGCDYFREVIRLRAHSGTERLNEGVVVHGLLAELGVHPFANHRIAVIAAEVKMRVRENIKCCFIEPQIDPMKLDLLPSLGGYNSFIIGVLSGYELAEGFLKIFFYGLFGDGHFSEWFVSPRCRRGGSPSVATGRESHRIGVASTQNNTEIKIYSAN